ncbi:biliverdin-producing heme oxygenase [Flavobacterium sp. J27]|uniref:biliverdin-producing heme oxygenase n=1 Tax=Flavobacterium sp. J27 TaxID=2060419 RepID=UPI00102FEEA8|nr:biliverdin-producing heme oxygenase [Flavobacterium sp. J27]
MITRIKEETKLFHTEVEKVLVKELKALQTQEEYATLLLKLYGFYFSVENKLQDNIEESIMPDIKIRKHISHLEKDLMLMGVSFLPINNEFSKKITSLSYALGVLYVIEGSTLGGQIIVSMIMKQLDLKDKTLLSYFNSYDAKTQDMWGAFKDNVENSSYSIDGDVMLQGAKDTFIALKHWLQ